MNDPMNYLILLFVFTALVGLVYVRQLREERALFLFRLEQAELERDRTKAQYAYYRANVGVMRIGKASVITAGENTDQCWQQVEIAGRIVVMRMPLSRVSEALTSASNNAGDNPFKACGASGVEQAKNN